MNEQLIHRGLCAEQPLNNGLLDKCAKNKDGTHALVINRVVLIKKKRGNDQKFGLRRYFE